MPRDDVTGRNEVREVEDATGRPKPAGKRNQAKPEVQQQGKGQTRAKVQPEQQTGGQAKPDTNATASITNVTVEQRTEITNVIVRNASNLSPLSTFPCRSASVPHHVHLHRLPARIGKIVPVYRHYEYFVLADGRIVIVDPDDLKIVVTLTA